MTDFNLILSQVRQRLEILYQIVNDLEASGGGGGGGGGTDNYNELSNKPQINSVTLSGNKSLSDLGIASTSDLAGKANSADVYAKTEVYTKSETDAEITGQITDLDVSSIGGSTKYIKSVGQADGLVTAETGNIDSSPTSLSTNLVQSGGVYTALSSKIEMTDVWGLSTNNITATDENKVNLDDETYWAPGLYRPGAQ